MSLYNQQNQGRSIGTPGLPKSQKTTKRVADIILNKDHAAYTGPDSIGIIFFTDEKTKESASDTTTLPRAKPQNLNNFTTPLIGELVNIIQSTSDNYYPDLGGNPNFTSNYYTPAINVYNNAGSNAVPREDKKVKGNKKSKTDQSEPTFEFQKEFRTSGAQEVASKMCNNYLRDLGYSSGRSDPRAPTYNLYREENGDYILRLEDSEENKVKLGSYYRENPNQLNLNPTEGGTVNQGKVGQRISFSANNKPHHGGDFGIDKQNRAINVSLGNDEIEDINGDAASVSLSEGQKVNIKTASNLIASLHSEYKPYVEPLREIEKKPAIVIPTTNPTSELQVEDHFSGLRDTITEVAHTSILTTENPFSDPVFDALDEAQDEEILTIYDENIYSYKELSSISDPYSAASRPENYTPSNPTEDDIINEESYSGQLPDSKVPQKVRYKPVFLQPTRKWTLISKRKFAQNINTFNISDNLKYSVMFVALKEQSTGDNIGGFNHNHYGIMADIGNWSFGSKIIGSISTTEGAGGQGIRTDKFRYFAVFNSTKGGIDFMWNTLKGKGFDSATEDNIVDLYIDKWLSPSPATAQKIKNNKRSTYSKIFNTAKDFINNVT